MANIYTTPILRTECIGNSLNTINTNFTSLDEALVTTSADLNTQISNTQNNLQLSATNISNTIQALFQPKARGIIRYSYNVQGAVASVNNSNAVPPNPASYRQLLNSFNIANAVRQTNTSITVNFQNAIPTPYSVQITQREGYITSYAPYASLFSSAGFTIYTLSSPSPTGNTAYELDVLVY